MLIHAPVSQAYLGQPLPLYVLLQDGAELLPALFVKYRIGNDEGELRLLPVDGYRAGEEYSLYAATLPVEQMKGETLSYRFVLRGREMGGFTVPIYHSPEGVESLGEVPVLLPLDFPERYYLSGGDLVLRVALLGCDDAILSLSVLSGEVPITLPAEQNELGEYLFAVPIAMLERLRGKLRFTVSAQNGQYTVSLGSARSPLAVRLVDNAGPTVLAISPAKGERAEEGSATPIKVKFFDGSGVNLRTSVFCLDGKNRSQDAEWSEEDVQYTPPRPLSGGAHTVELILRDKLGNRSYYRSVFYVGEEGREDRPPRNKIFHTPRLLLKGLSTLKHLLSDKEDK